MYFGIIFFIIIITLKQIFTLLVLLKNVKKLYYICKIVIVIQKGKHVLLGLLQFFFTKGFLQFNSHKYLFL